VQRAVEAARPLIDSRKHRLDVSLPVVPVQVSGDMTRLVQVIVNLLNNAAKYTPDGGHISISVAEEGADVLIRVKDNGMGIAPQMIEHVFDLFAQGERTLARTEGGLGIGLTLARRIVALHGGNITAASEGAGKGSTFTVRLPRLPEYARHMAAPRQRSGTQPRERRSVVVVDDNLDAAESMAILLRNVGHEVRIEHDGLAAIKELTRELPDVVLLDIGLPGNLGLRGRQTPAPAPRRRVGAHLRDDRLRPGGRSPPLDGSRVRRPPREARDPLGPLRAGRRGGPSALESAHPIGRDRGNAAAPKG
jgi:two-component system CheB/CheR fusion protein